MIAAQIHFMDIIHLFELGTLHKELQYLLEPLERFVQDVHLNLHSTLYRELVDFYRVLSIDK